MKKDKIIIGLAHDYISFEEGDKQIQVPIIYAKEIFELMAKSNLCTLDNVRQHSYQADYKTKVEMWVHDLGSFVFTPKVEKMIHSIKVEEKE